MERARATWTDERLDDLSQRVDDGFTRVDRRFDTLEARLDARFDAIDRRLDALQRAMIQFAGGMSIALLAALITVILTQG